MLSGFSGVSQGFLEANLGVLSGLYTVSVTVSIGSLYGFYRAFFRFLSRPRFPVFRVSLGSQNQKGTLHIPRLLVGSFSLLVCKRFWVAQGLQG